MANLRFKGWLAEHNVKQGEVAKLIGVSNVSMSYKVNGKSEFKISEIRTICKHYDISADIFL